MAGIDLDGNSGIDMYPEETRAAITAAGQADTTLNSTFDANLTRIGAIDSQLGRGPMGRMVAPDYNAAMAAVVARLRQIQTFATALTNAGLGAVRDYVAGDVAAARALTLPEPLPPAAQPAPATSEPADDPGTTAPHAAPTGGR